MISTRKDDADRAFRAAADRLAALEARLDAEQRDRYRLLIEKQDAELRRETERGDKARERYEAERRKHKVDATLDMIRRSAAAPRELRFAAREYAARQRHVEQCRVTDEELADALAHGLGIFGGSCGPGELWITWQGAGLKIWISWDVQNHVTMPPTFAGRSTIAMARLVYGIADPTDRQLALL